jgi:hypothetical protein
MEGDLSALIENSDEVILASVFRDNDPAVSPSGKQAMSYYDVTVLPTWKYPHKVGDLLSFALPGGAVRCGMVPPEYGPDDSAAVPPNFDSGDAAGGPYVLLLHESRGDETQLTPLRRAGGDGTQGRFALPAAYDYRDKYDRERHTNCSAVFSGGGANCIAALDQSQETVKIRYRLDPLKTKYEGMPVPDFLKEVQSVRIR